MGNLPRVGYQHGRRALGGGGDGGGSLPHGPQCLERRLSLPLDRGDERTNVQLTPRNIPLLTVLNFGTQITPGYTVVPQTRISFRMSHSSFAGFLPLSYHHRRDWDSSKKKNVSLPFFKNFSSMYKLSRRIKLRRTNRMYIKRKERPPAT